MIVLISQMLKSAAPECGFVHLLLDRSAPDRDMGDWIANSGHQSEIHDSAESMLESVRSRRPACLVVDTAFGGANGRNELAKILRDKNAPPIVFLTDRADVRWTVAAMKQGAVHVIEKPYDKDEFCEAIGDAIARDAIIHRLRERHESLQRKFEELSQRERLVIQLVVEGRLNKAIARELQMTERTVERVRAVVLDKVGANSAVQMASLLTEHRLLGELLH